MAADKTVTRSLDKNWLRGIILDHIENPCNFYHPPFKMLDRVYCIAGKFVNQYLIDTGDGGLALIDAGMESATYLLIDSIHRLGFDPRNIKHLFLTHGHLDHVGAAYKIQKLTGCKTYMCKGDMFFFEPGKDVLINAGYDLPAVNERFTVDEFYDYNKTYQIGDVTFRPVLTPGHTPGCTSILYDVPHRGKTVTCAMQGGMGLNGMSKAELEEAGFPLSLQRVFYESLLEQAKLKVDCYTPAHHSGYNLFERAEKDDGTGAAFIDPNAWTSMFAPRAQLFKDTYGHECGLV